MKTLFRQWMTKTYGIQDANDYKGTQPEEMAIDFAKHYHKEQSGNVLPTEDKYCSCISSSNIKPINDTDFECCDCGKEVKSTPPKELTDDIIKEKFPLIWEMSYMETIVQEAKIFGAKWSRDYQAPKEEE
ncbi:MAG: hypothetical protein IH795_05605 [Bacteroidetes bacterium]|nr:hypothetical protein [Bacteroidota bacterium]